MEVLHPILIHFPIAFLSTFYVLDLVWSKRIRIKPLYFEVKSFLIIIGALGTIAAVVTGESAEEAIRRLGDLRGPLIEMHSMFALFTMWLAVIIALSYIIGAIMHMQRCRHVRELLERRFGKIWKGLTSIATFFIETPISYGIALIGLMALLITGALGGAIVFGANNDPLASFLVKLLVH